MELINIGELLNAGIHGLLVIILAFGWWERREMRMEQFELIKLVMVAHPEANHTISSALKRKLQIVKNQPK